MRRLRQITNNMGAITDLTGSRRTDFKLDELGRRDSQLCHFTVMAWATSSRNERGKMDNNGVDGWSRSNIVW